MDYKQGVIGLTEHKDVLERLRGMRVIRQFLHHNEPVKDGATVARDASGAIITKPVFKDGYQAQFNGQFIIFFVGEPRTLPQNIADALEKSNVTHLTDKCPQCKGTGATPAGICGNCRGRKRVVKESDEGQILNYRILKVTRRYDALMVDPETQQSVPASIQTVDEAPVSSPQQKSAAAD